MSKNISVKINNGNKTLESVKLNSANQKVIIKAQPHVNYELVDEATQYAPEMIDTKRVGNDLHIAFEGTDINKESDLVLEGYYEHDNTELVLGMAEDGQYYAYVPQSGVESDAVTLLADQVFAPQALGGNSVTAPFWAFNPNWLWVAAGVAAVGGIIAAASGSHGGGSSNNANNNSNTAKDTTAPAKPTVEAKDNGSVEVTPPVDVDTKSVEVSYTDEAGTPKTATLTKGEDGNWTSNNPDVAVDPATGKATIPADTVKDGSPVTAKATDTAGNAGEEGTANAGNNPDTTAPRAPEVTPSTTDGSVAVKVPGDAQVGDTVKVTVTPEGSDTPEKVTLTKQADGSWTSDKPETVPNVDAGKDSTTIPQDKVKDGSEVTAQAKDPSGNDSVPVTAQAGENADITAPSKPTLKVLGNFSVSVQMPNDAEVGDFVIIEAANGLPSTTLTKQQDGSWISDKPETVPSIDAGKDTTIISNNTLGKSSGVTAQAKDPAGNSSEVAWVFRITPPILISAPEVTAKTDGSVEITPPTDTTTSVEVRYTDEAGTPKTATITKGTDGTWTSNNPDVAVEPATGKATIPADKVQDGSPVKAKATDNIGDTSAEGTANAGNNPDTTAPAKPTVEAKDNGSVEVTPPADADTKSVEVSYTDEAGTPKTATLTKGNDSNWTSNNPDVAVNPATGKAMIPADKVQDGSPVKAKATDNAGNTGEEGTANAGNNPDTTTLGKPTIEAKMNGFVYITPPADAKSVEVHYIDEEGNPQTVTITKDADKGWVSSNPDNDIWLNSETGKITLLAHKVKDGSLVKASATDNQGNTGEAATENAVSIPDTYAPSLPEIASLQDRSVKVTMPKEAEVGDSVVIKGDIYKDNDNLDLGQDEIDTSKTLATLTKQQDGSWISDKPENVPNVNAGDTNTVIPANTLKGFEQVYAYGIDPAGNQGPSFSIGLHSEIASPNVTVKTDGFVEITYPTDQDLKSMKVRYTDKAGTQKITILTKGEDGNWTSDNPDVTVDPATGKAIISADKIQPGSLVWAKVFTNSGIFSDEVGHVVGVGKKPDTPAPSAPELIPSTTDGSVTVKVPDNAKVGDAVEISVVFEYSDIFLNPKDSAVPFNLTLTKNADGSWTSSHPTSLPNIEAGQNSTTIPQDEIKDGSNVTAQARNPDYNYSELVTAQAGENAKDPDEAVSSNTIDSNGMGSSGDDYASFEIIAGTINMGAGNDILEARSTHFPFIFGSFYGTLQARIDMGSGDDIVKISGTIHDSIYKGISINGGDDFDTLEFVNRDGEAIITSITSLSNFEKIDIKGTLNNTLNIQKDDVERNHSAKPTVDDSGKSHNNVLIVDGDAGDKVRLNDISEVASSQVNYKGNTYHVYHTGSNELWVDSDIAVS